MWRRWVGVIGVAAVAAALAAVPAWATMYLTGGGGMFVPYKGTAGPSGLVQVLTTGGDRLRVGGEVEYRSYDSSILGVDNVAFDTIALRGIVQYALRSEGIRPYVGAGLGVDVNVIDSNKVERESPFVNVQSAGAGIGLLGLAGVEAPVTSRLSIFAEGRLSVDFQLTNQTNGGSNNIGVENLGGFTGLAGLRFTF